MRALLALAVVVLLSSCSSSDGSPPALTLAQLKARMITASDVGLTGQTMNVPPGRAFSHTALATESVEIGQQLLTVSLVSSVAQAPARTAQKSSRSFIEMSLAPGWRRSVFPVGVDGVEYRGADRYSKNPSIDVSFVQGAVLVQISLADVTPTPTPLPASAQALVERAARAQAAALR